MSGMRYISAPPTRQQVDDALEHLDHRMEQWSRLQKWANTDKARKSMPSKTYTALDAILQEADTYLLNERQKLSKILAADKV